ncbi:MAG: OmpA family protein [Bacteroidales bacterium]|nr:OmpA family protein [Bacteroidales bacterium]
MKIRSAKHTLLLIFVLLCSSLVTYSQDIPGYRFLKRIRGIAIEESKIQEILVDERANSIAISYRSKKILYLSIYKLYTWDKVNDYRLDGSVELYNSCFDVKGDEFFANFEPYKLLFAHIVLASGAVDTVGCSKTPRGCAPATTAQYKISYNSNDKMYLFMRDEERPNDLLVYVDKPFMSSIEDKMEVELGRDVNLKEVKDKMEEDARKKYGSVAPPKVASAVPTENTTSTTSTGTSTTAAPTKSIIITKDDIIKLMETGSFQKGDMAVKLDTDAKKALQTATSNPAVGSTPKSLDNTSFQVGEVVKLQNILFAQGKSELLPESFTELDKLVAIMKSHPTLEIQVNGHTNNIGTHNLEISEQRAKAVVDYVVTKGIVATRIKYKGYGDTQPIASNDTPEGQAKNRRVEFIITKK